VQKSGTAQEAEVRVLVVEDERRMASYICQALLEESFAVDCVHDGLSALDMARTCEYDVIILDLMLPGVDGLTLCSQLRKTGNSTPVLILSARDLVEDRVIGLNAGADDYLVKPFATQELVARVRALLRRRQGNAAPILRVGNLELNPSTRTVKRGGQPIPLTMKEYALLEYLMRRPGVVLTRTMIAEHVWDFTFDLASNVVDVYIKHLRDKINEPGKASYIQTVRGVGYTVRDPEALET
jgi:two-component system, OmpR family, copper resistance phosphate regulon response regulator CusR